MIRFGVEELPVHWDETAAGSAVQENHRHAARVADTFVIDGMQIRNRQHSAVERFDLGIEICHKDDDTRSGRLPKAIHAPAGAKKLSYQSWKTRSVQSCL